MRLMIPALVLGLVALPAHAFQETTVGGGNQGDAAAAAAPLPVVPPSGLDLSTKPDPKGLQIQVPGVSFGSRPDTEIKIPGLGTIGKMPKLDFGLELLYGASDPKAAVPESKVDPNDVQIRGTLKHRF